MSVLQQVLSKQGSYCVFLCLVCMCIWQSIIRRPYWNLWIQIRICKFKFKIAENWNWKHIAHQTQHQSRESHTRTYHPIENHIHKLIRHQYWHTAANNKRYPCIHSIRGRQTTTYWAQLEMGTQKARMADPANSKQDWWTRTDGSGRTPFSIVEGNLGSN